MRQVVHDATKQMRITPVHSSGQWKESKRMQLQSGAHEPEPRKKDEHRSHDAKTRQHTTQKLFGNEWFSHCARSCLTRIRPQLVAWSLRLGFFWIVTRGLSYSFASFVTHHIDDHAIGVGHVKTP